MKDSARTKQDESTGQAARPSWRFSGRRGTPVHLREQAPQTLPPEIRKAVTQLARERAGESTPAADAKPVRAGSNLKLARPDGQAPPVAAAPMPVERRTRSAATADVPTSHIPAAVPPIDGPIAIADVPTIDEPVVAIAQPETSDAAPVTETVAEPVAETVPEPVADVSSTELPSMPEAGEVDVEPGVPVEPGEPVALEPIATASTPVDDDPAVTSSAPESAVEAAPTPPAASTPKAAKQRAPKRAKQSKLSAAERKKLAKAKAKARAKAERNAKKDADGAAASEKARRLFARGRTVDADAAAVVEPVAEAVTEPAPEQTATAPSAAAQTALATPGPVEPTATSPEVDVPLPPDVSDLPDLVPSIDAIDEVEPLSFPTLEPALAWEAAVEPVATEAEQNTTAADADADAIVLEPALATESAAQAAWELGRLPFLLHDPTPPAAEPAPASPAPHDLLDVQAKLDELEAEPAATTWVHEAPATEPASARDVPATPLETYERTPIRATLQPIDWLPVGAHPTPAPIEPIDLPRRTAPDAIQRLDAPLELPRDDRSLARASAREGMTANARTAEARRRISRRRAELDDLVESLAGLGSGRRDT